MSLLVHAVRRLGLDGVEPAGDAELIGLVTGADRTVLETSAAYGPIHDCVGWSSEEQLVDHHPLLAGWARNVAAGALLTLVTSSGRARAPAAVGAAQQLATVLRAGRSTRRRSLATTDVGALLDALPLWVGTLHDIDDLLPARAAMFDLVVLDEAFPPRHPPRQRLRRRRRRSAGRVAR